MPIDENEDLEANFNDVFINRAKDPRDPWQARDSIGEDIDSKSKETAYRAYDFMYELCIDVDFMDEDVAQKLMPNEGDQEFKEILYTVAGSRMEEDWKFPHELTDEEMGSRMQELSQFFEMFAVDKYMALPVVPELLDTPTYYRLEEE